MESEASSQLLQAYLGGLATVLTPCIYPLIPVTLSLFGAASSLSRAKAFLLSLSYVCGICATYTALGIFSAKTGAVFGSYLGNYIVVSVLAIFFTLLALYSLEAIQLQFMSKIQNSAAQIGGKGYSGAFLMGAVSGFVAAPCVGPILVVFLALAAKSQNTAWGALLLFTYAFGFGSVFLVLGTFSHLLKALPRAGTWMNSVKFLTSALLFGVVVFLIQPFVPGFFDILKSFHNDYALAIAMIILALLGRESYKRSNTTLKVAACILFAISAFQLFVGRPVAQNTSENNASQVIWLDSIDNATKSAGERNTIAMVDLFADWCAACKELDHVTFSDSKVKENLQKIVTARLNFSITGDKEQAILDKYEVAGLPCILFLRADGSEVPESRITGFLSPEEFLKHLGNVVDRK